MKRTLAPIFLLSAMYVFACEEKKTPSIEEYLHSKLLSRVNEAIEAGEKLSKEKKIQLNDALNIYKSFKTDLTKLGAYNLFIPHIRNPTYEPLKLAYQASESIGNDWIYTALREVAQKKVGPERQAGWANFMERVHVLTKKYFMQHSCITYPEQENYENFFELNQDLLSSGSQEAVSLKAALIVPYLFLLDQHAQKTHREIIPAPISKPIFLGLFNNQMSTENTPNYGSNVTQSAPL